MSSDLSSEIGYPNLCRPLLATLPAATPASAGPCGPHATGTGTEAGRNAPCANLPCADSTECRCISERDRLKLYPKGSKLPSRGGFKIEPVIDDAGSTDIADDIGCPYNITMRPADRTC
jgi:hypothetical protein